MGISKKLIEWRIQLEAGECQECGITALTVDDKPIGDSVESLCWACWGIKTHQQISYERKTQEVTA